MTVHNQLISCPAACCYNKTTDTESETLEFDSLFLSAVNTLHFGNYSFFSIMGKRKRGSDQTQNSNDHPSSSDNIPCSSGTEVLSKEKPSQLADTSDLKPFPSGMEIPDNSVKLLNAHHHYNLGRSVFLKKSRHHYSHQYSRRNSVNHGNVSSSHGKGPPLSGERLSFKLASHCNTEPGSYIEKREKPFSRSERIRFSSLVMDAVSPDTVKMVCGICQKLLRQKAYLLGMGNTIPSGEQHVVAVLVCGHVYHADCLEQRTSVEDIPDPPCPLCLGSLSQVESSGHKNDCIEVDIN